MSLTEERMGQIAMLALLKKMEQEGIRLNPKVIRREIINEAKNLDIPASELAKFLKIVIKSAFDKTMAELDLIK